MVFRKQSVNGSGCYVAVSNTAEQFIRTAEVQVASLQKRMEYTKQVHSSAMGSSCSDSPYKTSTAHHPVRYILFAHAVCLEIRFR